MAYQANIMKVTSGMAKNNVSSFSFPSGFAGGMNTRYTGDLIENNQSPDMQNMNYDDGGVPTKRAGFSRLNNSWGASGVQGFYDYWITGATSPVYMLAWGGKMYSFNPTTGAKTDLCTGSKAAIADAQTTFFTMDDTCYFLTGTDYCSYDGTNPVADVTGYVPTITLGRSPDGATSTVHESLNLLSNSWIDSFSGTTAGTVYTLSYTDIDSVDSAYVGGSLVAPADYTVDLSAGTVTFDSAPGEGTNNVTITATKAGVTDSTQITQCTIAAIYGGKADTRVFVAGHPTYRNYQWCSGITESGPDPTYFPADGFIAVDNDAEAITGMCRMIDYLLVFKERSQYYQTIDDSSSPTVFPILPLNNEYGCVAPRSVLEVDNGVLALSNRGVTWTRPSMVRSQATVDIVSLNVNKDSRVANGTMGLLNNSTSDLANAHAVRWGNKYLLHIGTTTWVLDLDYSSFSDGVFCWYPYTGLYQSAGQFLEVGEYLYLASNAAGLMYRSSATSYNDDATAINAYWTSPLLYLDYREYIKKFESLFITFNGQISGTYEITWITDEGEETVNIVVSSAATFDYSTFSYDGFTYGVPFYPSTQREKIGFRGEYVQWRVRNNTVSEAMTILGQTLKYSLKKEVR